MLGGRIGEACPPVFVSGRRRGVGVTVCVNCLVWRGRPSTEHICQIFVSGRAWSMAVAMSGIC